MLKDRRVRPMTNAEAKDLLVAAFNNRVIKVSPNLSDENYADCMQALCVVLNAAPHAPEVLTPDGEIAAEYPELMRAMEERGGKG